MFGSDQQGARNFVNAINDFIVNGRVNVAALANSGVLVADDGSNLLSGYTKARSKPYNREFAKFVRAYAKGEVGQYLGDGNIQDVTSFENVMVTDQKAATDGVIDSAAIQNLKNAILRMVGPIRADRAEELAIYIGQEANRYLARNTLGAATIRFNKEGEQPFVKTPYGYVEVGGDFDGRQGVPTRIAIQTTRLPTSEHGFPESFNDYSRLLGVTYHEAFHAGKRLVLTQDDQALLDRVITPEFAMKNGVSKEWFDAYPPEYRLEEAQAQIFSLWAAGVPIKGMQAPVRRRLKTLKDFFDAVSSWARGEGFIKKIVDPDATSEIEQVKKLFEDFDSGELARQAGRLDDQALKKYAGVNAAPNYEALVGAPIKRTPGFGGVANPFKDGFFNNSMRDLGFFGRLISHPSDLAQKNKLFRPFYNALQKRVQIRNRIKGSAVNTGVESLRALRGDQRKLTSVMIQLSNNGKVEPTYDLENGTVEVSIPKERYDEIEVEYGTEDKFLSMLGVDPSTVSIQRTEEGVTFTISGQPEVAKAVAAVRGTSNYLSDSLFTSVLHSFINGRELSESGLADIIRTIDDAGQPADYNNVIADLQKLLDVNNNPFLEKTTDKDGVTRIRLTDAFANASLEEKKAAFPALKEEYLNRKDTPQKLDKAFETIQGLLSSRIDGYFPNYRYGDSAIIVKDSKGKVVYFETIPSTFLDRFGSRKEDKLNEIRSELQAQYPNMTVSKPFTLKYDKRTKRFAGLEPAEQQALFESMNILEEIALRRAGLESQKEVEELINEVNQTLFANRITKLIQPRQNIPGYINSRNNDGSYLFDSFVRSIDTTANTASSLFTEPELFGSLKNLEKAGNVQPKYLARANEIYEYVNNPKNEAPITRAFAFHMFLGYNVSSAVVNLTQSFQATYPVLGAITGLGSGGVYVAKALKDSSALYGKMLGSKDKPSLGEYGFSFFKTEIASDGTVSVEIDMSKRPESITEEEYRYLAELFRTGVIQPIQNIDLGAARLQELDVRRGVAPLLNASGYAFGVIENTNRIAAALSFYRAAKDPKNRKNFEAFVSGTRFGDQDVSKLDTEDFAKLMGTMGVEKTQFFMGQENRPAIMQGPVMSVVTQFQSFLYQMVGMYGDALFKSLNGRMDNYTEAERPLIRKMAMKQLAAMTLSMMAFGGAMGLPFMENLKEIIKFFTEQFGDQVGEDFEEELRVTLGDTMGYTATDALLRGIPRMLGADVSRRTGYGDVVPLRLLMGGDPIDFAGPAVSRAVDMVKGTKEAYDNGDLLGAAVGVLPIAARNAYEGLVKEPSVGTFTARGQQLLPAGSLSGTERLMKTLGFTPTTVSRARERRGLENYLSYRSKVGRDVYTNRMTKNLGAYMAASQRGDMEAANKYLNKYFADMMHGFQHDFDHVMEPSRQYRINPQTPMNRVMRAMDPFGYGTGPRVPKAVRPELFTRILGEAAYSE